MCFRSERDLSRAALKSESALYNNNSRRKENIYYYWELNFGDFQSVLHVPLKRGKVRERRLFPVIARCARLSARCAAASESSALSSAKDDIFGERHNREAGWHMISNGLFLGFMFCFGWGWLTQWTGSLAGAAPWFQQVPAEGLVSLCAFAAVGGGVKGEGEVGECFLKSYYLFLSFL